MEFGRAHGIQFRFQDGLLAGVGLDVHHKTAVPLAETLTGPGVAVRLLGPPVDADFDGLGGAGSLRSSHTATMAQDLGAGRRELVLMQSALTKMLDDRVVAALTLTFTLDSPVEWRLTVPGSLVTGAPDDKLRVRCGQNVYLSARGDVPVRFTDGVIEADLPMGTSQLYLSVVSNPDIAVTDTIVVCRPDQLREAAIVVSCLPSARFTPIVSMSPRPVGTAPYNSWIRHNTGVGKLLETARVNRVVYLFEPAPEDLACGDGVLFSSIPEQTYLLPDLQDLALMAWQQVAGHEGEPPDWVEVPADDTSAYPAALFAALAAGLPLKPVVGTPADLLPRTNERLDTDEAVIVELNGVADDLLAVLYAWHRSARLVPMPPPRLDSVNAAVAAYQEQVLAGRLLTRNRFASLERAVTAEVPAEVIAAVGERRLTAFTQGLPYSFVRTDTADWSGKTIGYVATDPLLIILSELCAAGSQRPQATFSLLFDPGFFDTSETADVLQAVHRHYTHPIVLAEQDAGLDALRSLSRALPAELVFFNTHGSEDAIVLGDTFLSREFIPQFVSFESLPIVFNNSCASWTGVGREFVRVGARGYIGSLWSVRADLAAEFATVVAERITAGDTPVAAALIDTGLPEVITRAYIYAGTANGRLDQWPERASAPGEAPIAACMTLLQAARQVSDEVSTLLGRELTQLLEAVEGTPYASSTEYADALFGAVILAASQPRSSADRDRADRLAALLEQVLDRPGVAERARAGHRAMLCWIAGLRHENRRDNEAALAAFRDALEYGDACPDRALLQLRVAELLADQGDPATALEYATQARDSMAEAGDEAGLVTATGVLGRLQQRTGDLAAGLEYAHEGFAAAGEDLARQARFKGDQAAAELRMGEYAASVRSAEEALRLARLAGDERGELAGYGLLAQALLAVGDDLDEAERLVWHGLAESRRLDLPYQEAAFRSDLGLVLAARDRHQEAVAAFREAISLYAELSDWDAYARNLLLMQRSALPAGDPDALWMMVIHGTACWSKIQGDLRDAMFDPVVEAFKSAVIRTSVENARRVVPEMFQLLESISGDDPSNLLPAERFLGDLATVVMSWTDEEADQQEVVRLAGDLDEQTGGRFALVEYVSRRHPFWKRRGRKRRRWF